MITTKHVLDRSMQKKIIPNRHAVWDYFALLQSHAGFVPTPYEHIQKVPRTYVQENTVSQHHIYEPSTFHLRRMRTNKRTPKEHLRKSKGTPKEESSIPLLTLFLESSYPLLTLTKDSAWLLEGFSSKFMFFLRVPALKPSGDSLKFNKNLNHFIKIKIVSTNKVVPKMPV